MTATGNGMYILWLMIWISFNQDTHYDEIRMVLLHELCHIKYSANGKSFNKTLEDMLVRVGLMAEEERVVKPLYSKHREVGYYESLPLRKYRGTF